jgi:hypothetical protein
MLYNATPKCALAHKIGKNGGEKGSNWWGFYIAKTIDMHAPVPVSVANIHAVKRR